MAPLANPTKNVIIIKEYKSQDEERFEGGRWSGCTVHGSTGANRHSNYHTHTLSLKENIYDPPLSFMKPLCFAGIYQTVDTTIE